MKKKRKIQTAVIGAVLIAGIAAAWIRGTSGDGVYGVTVIAGADGPTSVFAAGKVSGEAKQNGYISIPMKEAQKLLEEEGDYTILDVRRPDEFAGGHIPGAVNVPNEEIGDKEPEELPDKEQIIYVYCRSGNRSRQAAEKLAAMGYTGIVEIGGINDWTGETEQQSF